MLRGDHIVRAHAGRVSAILRRQGDISAPLIQAPCWGRLFANEAVEGPPAAKDPESARGFETQGPATEQGEKVKDMEEKFEGWRAPSATTGAMAQTAAGQPPGVPGAQTVRTQGNPQPVAPLQADPVGPANVATGPGRGPADFEKIQKRSRTSFASGALLHSMTS
ncbi:hypothetical protein CVIRNUC_010350 [Coccomyxa viridis]|uniref:Uncharacterized protein n=1 Tax=Coccomyxa viridis TaxID=1274662 RepID=A0AAV1IJ31_9CHLO|nr:hypothetical protein CVIRNUC_010350 [Coccomyxa viridis]